MYKVICGMCIILSLWLPGDNVVNAKRILVITIAPFYSHQIVYQSLCLALNKRGHEIVILTARPKRDPTLTNYTEINISATMHIGEQFKKQMSQLSVVELSKYAFKLINVFCNTIFDEPKFKEIYRSNSNEKFDAVIVEAVSPSLFTMAHRFNAPLIGIMSLGIHNYQRYVFGSPILPSHPSNWEVNTLVENPSIWQRLQNFIDTWSLIHYWNNDFITTEQETAEKYLGNNIPQVIDTMKNMKLMLVNENSITAHPRPGQTNAVYFTGFHVQKTLPPLQKDLRRFLHNATEGFIYISFGTTITCNNLPKDMLENFVEVFSKLPYKIIWKYDCDELSKKPDNAFISKWFPQQSVLAHPNIKLFIYQGGLQSTEEAIYYAVPILGIPFVSEQQVRIQRLVSLGATIHLKLNEITKECLNTAIHQILSDKSYKEKMTYLSSLFKDQPYDSMEIAIRWVEFVMRYKEVNLFRFSESDKPWYQRYEIDIIALLATALFILTCIIILIIFQIVNFIFNNIRLSFSINSIEL